MQFTKGEKTTSYEDLKETLTQNYNNAVIEKMKLALFREE